jgi:hypothetical protein
MKKLIDRMETVRMEAPRRRNIEAFASEIVDLITDQKSTYVFHFDPEITEVEFSLSKVLRGAISTFHTGRLRPLKPTLICDSVRKGDDHCVELPTLSAQNDQTCRIGLDSNDKKALDCFGNGMFFEPFLKPGFIKDPKQVFGGNGNSCVLDGNEVKCIYEGSQGIKSWHYTGFTNARQACVGVQHVCVLDGNTVKCRGKNTFGGAPAVFPGLKNPRQVACIDDATCVLDGNTVKCLGSYGYSGTKKLPNILPGLKNPRYISGTEDTLCVLDGNEAKCFGENKAHFKNLSKPRSVCAGLTNRCVLDGDEVRCNGDNRWGGAPEKISDLKNPTELSCGVDYLCVADDEGIKCRGPNKFGQAPPLR